MLEYREPSVAALRDVVEHKQAVKFRYGSNANAFLIDLQTANVICMVYDALTKNELKEKFERMVKTPNGIVKLANFCWSKVKVG